MRVGGQHHICQIDADGGNSLHGMAPALRLLVSLNVPALCGRGHPILCYVDARELKKENMVKLPVVVYNRQSKKDVIVDAIQLRGKLEAESKAEQSSGGRYIRPIVLFQAQPKGTEEAATFEKLKEELIGIGIPQDQIAIKTSEINEIKNKDLLSENCAIRYIITVAFLSF